MRALEILAELALDVAVALFLAALMMGSHARTCTDHSDHEASLKAASR